MFSGSSGVPPPPPPSYLHCFPPYLPPLPPAVASGLPPYDISQRPPPLGGRLSSPPPMLPPPTLHRPPVSGGRYENTGSPPPPMSPPHLLPPFDHHRSLPPFGGDHIPPPLPPPGSILPPPLGATHSWGEESLPRNSGFHPQREQRARNHKGLWKRYDKCGDTRFIGMLHSVNPLDLPDVFCSFGTIVYFCCYYIICLFIFVHARTQTFL